MTKRKLFHTHQPLPALSPEAKRILDDVNARATKTTTSLKGKAHSRTPGFIKLQDTKPDCSQDEAELMRALDESFGKRR